MTSSVIYTFIKILSLTCNWTITGSLKSKTFKMWSLITISRKFLSRQHYFNLQNLRPANQTFFDAVVLCRGLCFGMCISTHSIYSITWDYICQYVYPLCVYALNMYALNIYICTKYIL